MTLGGMRPYEKDIKSADSRSPLAEVATPASHHLAFPTQPFQSEVCFTGYSIMPDEKKLDPFKPQQPVIPGVMPRAEVTNSELSPAPEYPGAPGQEKSQPKAKVIGIAAAGVVILLVGLIVWGRSASHKTAPVADDSTATPESATSAAPKPQPSEPIGPGVIATVGELSEPWATKHFRYRSYVSGQLEPAMVVHLSRGGYWGFSLNEPFGTCQLEFVTDLDKLQADYGYRADHPMVANPCNHTVYDLLRYGGGASTDDLVRGVVVKGNGIRPPMAIEIKVQGNNIIAGRAE